MATQSHWPQKGVKIAQWGDLFNCFSGLILGKSWSSRPTIWSIKLQQNLVKTSVYIKNCLSWPWIGNCKILAVINFSVVRIHLVHFGVQVITWWWYKFSRGLIGTEGICWHCYACGAVTVNVFVVLTKIEFATDNNYQYSSCIKLQ